jgi:hypothetical protein
MRTKITGTQYSQRGLERQMHSNAHSDYHQTWQLHEIDTHQFCQWLGKSGNSIKICVFDYAVTVIGRILKDLAQNPCQPG